MRSDGDQVFSTTGIEVQGQQLKRQGAFTASGLVEAPLWPVVAIVAVTTPLWTGALFAAAWTAGEAGAERFLMAAVPIALILIASVQIVRALSRRPARPTFP